MPKTGKRDDALLVLRRCAAAVRKLRGKVEEALAKPEELRAKELSQLLEALEHLAEPVRAHLNSHSGN